MINQATLIGHLGRDPETGETDGGQRYARLSLATSESWRDKASGERRERTEWHRIVVWGDGLANMLETHARKGTKLLVQGAVRTREFEKDGQKRWATEVVVSGAGGIVRLMGQPGDGSGVPAPDAPPEGWGGREGSGMVE